MTLRDGGTGVDTMKGGAGNDMYYVANASDALFEATNAGCCQLR
jgi:serralysin